MGKQMNVDAPKEIRRAVDTGTVSFGYRNTEKNILKGKGEIVIISKNCPQRLAERIRHYSRIARIPFFEFEGSALELGSICGKPFLVSTLLVLDKGKSKVMELSSATAQSPAPGKHAKQKKPVAKKTPRKKTKAAAKKARTKTKAPKPKKTASRKK